MVQDSQDANVLALGSSTNLSILPNDEPRAEVASNGGQAASQPRSQRPARESDAKGPARGSEPRTGSMCYSGSFGALFSPLPCGVTTMVLPAP
jgi:hypothetical protein